MVEFLGTMLALFAVFALIQVPHGQGVPILSRSPEENRPQLDDPEMTATEIIDKINEAVDIEPKMYEGDILITLNPGESPELLQKRNAQRYRQYLWKTKIVPYEVSETLVKDGYMPTIQAAIQQFTEHTCVKWKPRQNEERWVMFVKKSGCYSSVGMNYWKKGSQDISLGRGCNHQGVTMHEMMHAVGFWHEQSRYDRDQYVEIMWENIQPGKEHNFNKYNLNRIDYLNEVYDLESIMHYGRTSFSIENGKPTIRAIGDPNKQLGQRNGFSKTDIAQINALYDCSGPSGGWSSWTVFGPCDNQCRHVRQRFCASHDLNNCPGADKIGIETQVEDCKEKCYEPVDGHWGRWSSWGACSVSCDSGKHSRTRQCDDPAPKNGGKACAGDDKQLGNCVLRRCGLGPYDCEFEAGGMCHWKLCNEQSYPRWYRQTGPTGSSGTGPKTDHTSGSGYYLYFEASSPAQPGQTSCFFSQEFPGGSCHLLTFWYHMLGSGIGKLSVQIKTSGGTESVWEKSGEQGDKWIQGSVEIKSDLPYKVYFEGQRGGDYRGDIAIDDIAFKDCPSTLPPATKPPSTMPQSTMPPSIVPPSTVPPSTKSPSTVPPSTVPPLTMPPSTVSPSTVPSTTVPPTTLPPTTLPPTQPSVLDSCSFDGGTLCDWTNNPSNPELPDGARYDWQLQKGATPSKNTGPSGDHSANGQGGYIYLDSSTSHAKGSKALLTSKEFPGGSTMCLQFWYHMFGRKGMGKFRVFIQKRKRRWEQFRKSGNRGNRWNYRQITINRNKNKTPFKVVFEGERGKTGLSDMAVDDVKVVSGVCK